MTDLTEAALWASIEAAPEDGLRRLVLADYLEERAGKVEIEEWVDAPIRHMGSIYPSRKKVKRFVSDGRAEMAAALRGTAAYSPYHITTGFGEYWWYDRRNYYDDIPADYAPDHLPGDLFDALPVECGYIDSDGQIAFKRFDTATDAIRDLCRAYIVVHIKSEVPA